MHSDKLDEIDLKILETMQQDGRIKRKDLAESVHLTIPAVSERMRKLEEEGYITNFAALVNPRKVGLGVSAFIFIVVESSSYYRNVIERAINYKEIIECHAITGGGSHILKVRTRDVDHLEKLLTQVQAWEGVKSTKTNLILSSPKETTELPLDHLKENINS